MDWPQENEQLFKIGGDIDDHAKVTPYWASLAEYGENYKNAADAIITAAVNREMYIDSAVYPAVFLYRHYLELTLKDIIFRSRRLENKGNGFPKTHKLSILWQEAKQLLKQHYDSESPKELDYLDGCFKELDEHDPDSMAFRYPFDKKGNKHLMNLPQINVRHLMDTMDRIANFLSCIAAHIAERLQYRSDMEADMEHEDRS
ncbi:MAG: hypothetical protein HQ567_12435 [Candidatus Nealsonbacteria bacterium]|nr:hypothetical protein [Candidatus Nealsonbacteria bacterium]